MAEISPNGNQQSELPITSEWEWQLRSGVREISTAELHKWSKRSKGSELAAIIVAELEARNGRSQVHSGEQTRPEEGSQRVPQQPSLPAPPTGRKKKRRKGKRRNCRQAQGTVPANWKAWVEYAREQRTIVCAVKPTIVVAPVKPQVVESSQKLVTAQQTNQPDAKSERIKTKKVAKPPKNKARTSGKPERAKAGVVYAVIRPLQAQPKKVSRGFEADWLERHCDPEWWR